MKHQVLLLLSVTVVLPATAPAQELAVDHLWIRVNRGAPEAAALEEAGFRFERFDQPTAIAPVDSSDSRRVEHRGQGTASMVVRFRNVYLELIWVEEEDVLREIAPRHGYTLLEREASPIGIGLRHVGDDAATLPFESYSHWAAWMRPHAAIATASRSPDAPIDPAIFVIPRYMRWDLRIESNPALLESARHRLDLGNVTRIRVHGPGLPSSSPAVQALNKHGLVEFRPSRDHLLEIEFDGGRSSTLDLRPSLPLLVYY